MLHCLIKTVSISRKPNLSGGGGHDEPDEIFTDFLCSAPEIYQLPGSIYVADTAN